MFVFFGNILIVFGSVLIAQERIDRLDLLKLFLFLSYFISLRTLGAYFLFFTVHITVVQIVNIYKTFQLIELNLLVKD